MDTRKILSIVDHTLLRPTSSWAEIKGLCEEAIQLETASVCIPPSFVKRVRDTFNDLCICTVIGFPLGYSTTTVKIAEAKEAIEDGADEIDMVINQGAVKDGNFSEVTKEISSIKAAIGNHCLKVIVETCNLTEQEKIEVCKCVTDGGADFIKTSTGFGVSGAKLEDIRLFKEHIGPNIRIKAAGGEAKNRIF